MSEDGQKFLNDLAEVLRSRASESSKIVQLNLTLGRMLHARYNGSGEEKLQGIAIALNKKGVPVSPSLLIEAYRVYGAIGGEQGAERIRREGKGVSWGALVKEAFSPPTGESRGSTAFWENYLKRVEQVHEQAEVIAAHFNEIPQALKEEAAGALAALGYQVEGLTPNSSVTPVPFNRKTVEKILHTGDLHYDDTALLPEIHKSNMFLVAKAREEQPDLAIIAGDITNTRQFHDSAALLKAIEFLVALADICPVFVIRGTTSHDGITVQLLQSFRTRHPVYVAESIGMIGFADGKYFPTDSVEGLDALIYALPPVSKAQLLAHSGTTLHEANAKLIDLLRDVFQAWGVTSDFAREQGAVSILVSHGTVSGAQTSTGQQMVGRDFEYGTSDLALARADLVALAHIHKAQHWGNIFYCGSTAKQNVGEIEEKGFWMHELRKGQLQSRFVVIPTRDIIPMAFDGLPSLEDLPEITPDSLVRVTYKVSEEEVHSVDEEAIRRKLLEQGAGEVRIEKSVIPKVMTRAAGISLIPDLAGKLKKWGETTGTEITESLLSKVALLQQPLDVAAAELEISITRRR